MSCSGVRTVGLLLALALPSVAAAQDVKAAATPSAAVQEFMRAVADSNLTRMAQLFGNAKGASARTHQPVNYEKRMVTTQLFLRGVQARTLGDVPTEKGGMRSITTQLAHNGCTVTLSVNVVHAKEGWLVHDFDLDRAAQVNRPCDTSKRPGNSPE
jgi:hypothetical protein